MGQSYVLLVPETKGKGWANPPTVATNQVTSPGHRSWHRDQYSPIRFWSRAVVHWQLPLGIGPRLCSAGRLEPATRRVSGRLWQERDSSNQPSHGFCWLWVMGNPLRMDRGRISFRDRAA